MKILYGWYAARYAFYTYLVLIFYGAMILLSVTYLRIKYLGVRPSLPHDAIFQVYDSDGMVSLVASFLLVGLIEEFIFRFIPLLVTQFVISTYKLGNSPLWLFLIISSIIFGYLHGSWINIFFTQGLGGLAFGLIMIKSSGGHYRYGYLYAALVHWLYDCTIAVFTIYIAYSFR